MERRLAGDPWGLRPRLRRLVAIHTILAAVLVVAGLGEPYQERAVLAAALVTVWATLLWGALLVPPRPRAPRIDGRPVLRCATWRRGVLTAAGWPFIFMSILSSDRSMRIAGLAIAAAVGVGVWWMTAGRVRLTRDGIEPLPRRKARPPVSWSAIAFITPAADVYRSGYFIASAVVGPSAGVLLGVGRRWPVKVVGTLDGYPEFLAMALERAPAAIDSMEPRERDRLVRIAKLSTPALLGAAR